LNLQPNLISTVWVPCLPPDITTYIFYEVLRLMCHQKIHLSI